VPRAALVRPVSALVRLSNGGECRRRRLGVAGDRIGCAFELPDHRAEFEFEQFENFLGGIAVRSIGRIDNDRRPHRQRFDRGYSRFQLAFFEIGGTPLATLGTCK